MDVKFISIILIVLTAIPCIQSVQRTKKVICYYSSSTYYRNYNQSSGSLEIQDIPVELCTHVIYAFIGLNRNGTVNVLDPYVDVKEGGFEKMVELKQTSPSKKILISLGGVGIGSENISWVVGNISIRSIAALNLLEFLKFYQFDGLDVNWVYPSPADKDNFAAFLRELKMVLTSGSKLLSVCVSHKIQTLHDAYDLVTLVRTANWISVTTYDYHPVFAGVTGHNAPLYPVAVNQSSASTSINYLLFAGIPSSKLVMGSPLYGISFLLKDDYAHDVGSPTWGPGAEGPYSHNPGTLDNTEVCEMIKNVSRPSQIVWDAHLIATYVYHHKQWVSVSSDKDMFYKGLYASSQRLGGVMVWDLVFDNPHGGACSRFHMLKNLVCGLMHCFRQAEILLSEREHQVNETHCDHIKPHIYIKKS